MPELRKSMCTFCEAMCGLQVEIEGDKVLSVRGDQNDIFSKGYICPKGVGQKEIHHDPDRLTHPIIKEGDKWREASWEEAYDLAASKFVEIQQEHGNEAFGFYFGNPAGHDYKTVYALLASQQVIKTRNVFSSNSVDAHPRLLTSYFMYGNSALFPVPDIDRTELLIIMGANPAVSNGSVLSAPGMKNRLKEIRDSGGKVIVIDPRFTETASIADEHIYIQPGTDAAFLLSVINELDKNGWVHPDAYKNASEVDLLLRKAREYSAEVTAHKTRIAPSVAYDLARQIHESKTAAWYGRMGVSTQSFGCVSTWLIDAINILTGNFDKPGGAMFTTPAVDMAGVAKKIGFTGSYAQWRSRVGKHPELGGEFPVAAMAEEILTPGQGQIKGMMIQAANPVLSNPNGTRVEQAFRNLDFLVCIDFYLNETTRLADLIIPPLAPLEHEHYPLVELSYAVRNVARYTGAAVEVEKDRPDDSEILLNILSRILRKRGGLINWFKNGALKTFASFLHSERFLSYLLRTGPHKLRLKDLKATPEGIDLGPLKPRREEVVNTPDSKANLFPQYLVNDLKRLDHMLRTDPNDDRPFSLITRRTLKSMNTWLHNSPMLMKGKPRCTLEMHEDDAKMLGLTNGDIATITSRIGEINVPVQVNTAMLPGVVSLPFGWGHDREGSNLNVASKTPGVSFNDIADDMDYDAVSGTSVVDGIPVSIRAQVQQ